MARRRLSNPLHVRRLYNIISASKGKQTLYLNAKGKLTRTEVNAKRFPNADAAIRRASALVREHSDLRGYHFSIRFAYG